MNEDMSNILSKFKSMMENNSVQDNSKNSASNFENSSDTPNSNESSLNISPEMIQNVMEMLNKSNSNSSSETSSSTNNSGIDFETILKMKNIMEKMNSKDDPRANLLLSLKPYLRDSRKGKIEQYIQLFNMSKVMDVFKNTGGENKK